MPCVWPKLPVYSGKNLWISVCPHLSNVGMIMLLSVQGFYSYQAKIASAFKEPSSL